MQIKVCKEFEISNFVEYCDLYLKSITLRLTGVFELCLKLYLKIYHLDAEKFLPATGLVWIEHRRLK